MPTRMSDPFRPFPELLLLPGEGSWKGRHGSWWQPVASHVFTGRPSQSPSCHLGPSSHCPPQAMAEAGDWGRHDSPAQVRSDQPLLAPAREMTVSKFTGPLSLPRPWSQ